MIEKESSLGPLLFIPGTNTSTFVYANRPLVLKKKTTTERLLVSLVRRRSLNKATIVKTLFNREYDAMRDDKIVYYHIHTLRKRLKTIGVPAEAIIIDGNNYRWLPEVKMGGEEACA